jgi:hypothetical protein
VIGWRICIFAIGGAIEGSLAGMSGFIELLLLLESIPPGWVPFGEPIELSSWARTRPGSAPITRIASTPAPMIDLSLIE